jgi:putative oxidoreductase
MNLRFSPLYKLSIFLLILLWIYSASSKVIVFKVFEQQMSVQALPTALKMPLTYMVPFIEFLAAALLYVPATRQKGLLLSAWLMLGFTGYIAYVLFGISDQHPCSCGGILGRMGWKGHFYFNLFYLLLTITAIYFTKRTEKGGSLARQI